MTGTEARARDRTWRIIRFVLIVIVVAGLAIDAYVHFDLANTYKGVKTSTLSQADLFRVEGVVAILAAVLLVVRPRRSSAAVAAVVAGAGVLAVLVYRYFDIGRIGPIPNMYEAIWYTEKTVSAIAEGVALIAALLLLVVPWERSAPAVGGAHERGRNPRA
jgi:hypothetical protein